MTIKTIARTHGRFTKCASKQLDVNIHAHQVEQVDYAALQLLCAMVKQVRENGRVIKWRKPSSALLHVVDTTGLSAALGLGSYNDSGRVSDV